MKPNYLAILSMITLMAIMSTALYTTLNEIPTPPLTSSNLTLVGVMDTRIFPVTTQGPDTGYSHPYQNSNVLVMENREGNASKTYYLYSPGFHREMMQPSMGGNGLICGYTLDEISDAYVNGLRVEISGTPLQLSREGREYELLEVKAIKILDKDKMPLVVYHFLDVNATNDVGRVSLPQSLIVQGVQPMNLRVHNYQILLREGDAVGFEFNSTQQVGFTIYAPGVPDSAGSRAPQVWYSENTTHLKYGLIALRGGTYDFVFTSISPADANLTFDAWRVKWDPSDVLFKESGGSSSGFGGMGWGTIYYEPPPRSFVVGRTWYNSTWTDHSISFEATLQEDTNISYGYNATEPVTFSFGSESGPILSQDNLYSYNSTYRIPLTGIYTFSFDIVQPKTAIVAFRCRAANASSLSYPGQTAALIEKPQTDEVKLNYTFPPAISQTTTIVGKLKASTFPTTKGRVMTLMLENSTTAYLLHLGTPSEFITVPTEGYKMLGNITLTDLNNAYLGNSTVRVSGFPFQLTLNGVVYDLFHVNSAEIIGPYPLYAQQSSLVVSGFYYQGLDSDKIEHFPIRFNLGFDNYTANGETYYGNIEWFYSSYLKQGAAIRISYNSTEPVEFGFYIFNYNPDVSTENDFELAKPGDYIIRESNVQNFEQLFNVPRSGFYTFAFKASGGIKSSVVLDVSMIK